MLDGGVALSYIITDLTCHGILILGLATVVLLAVVDVIALR